MKTHEVRPYMDSDAQDVATLFNESNDVWPGGFNQGKIITAEDVRHWFERMEKIEVYLAIADGHARAYCSLIRSITEERDSAYVGLLGATPKYHGKGLGRDVLRASITKAINEGIKRVDLHTWAANLKAVPLYKKTGFFWVPDTTVFMQNFIPMIVTNPFASDFFKDVDWYQIQERELELCEDIEEWEGMKVYTYRFNRDGEILHVKINTLSRQIVFFEDSDRKIALKAPQKKALKGRKLDFIIEIEKKTGKREDVQIKGFGKYGIQCAEKRSLSVDKTKIVQLPFTIQQNARKGNDYEPYPTVGVTIELGGKSMDLAMGFDAKPVVEINAAKKFPSVISGSTDAVTVELSNNAENSIKGKLIAAKSPDFTIEKDNLAFEIPSEGKISIDLPVKVTRSIVIPISCEYKIKDGEKGETAPTDLPILVDEINKASSVRFMDDKFNLPVVRIIRNGLVLEAHSRGGKVSLANSSETDTLLRLSPTTFGPPYQPSTMEYATHDVKAVSDDTIEISAKVDKDPSLIYTRRIILTDSGWLQLTHIIKNTSSEKRSFGLRGTMRWNIHWANLKFKRDGHIVSGMFVHDGYPVEDELPKKRDKIDEGWFSLEIGSLVKGLVMPDDVYEINKTWGGWALEWRFDKIPANSSVTTNSYYLYAGPGTWKDIRNGWWRFIERRNDIPPEAEVRELKHLSITPTIPIISDKRECEIVLSSERLVPTDGVITLKSDKNLKLNRKKLTFQGVKKDNPFKEKVEVENHGDAPSVSQIQMRLESPSGIINSENLVLTVDSKAKTKIAKSKNEWIISNGLASFKADPDWGSGIYSFNSLGKEWMFSPYPDKKAMFAWYNPFRGGINIGICAEMDDWFHKGYLEDWSISETSESVSGLNFKGVEMKALFEKREKVKGCQVTSRFMLSEGHRILRIVAEFENVTNVTYRAEAKADMFFMVHPENRTVQRYDYGLPDERIACQFGAYHTTTGWIITENPKTKESLLVLLEPTGHLFPHTESLWSADHGYPYGQHAGTMMKLHLAPGEKRKMVMFVVPCANPREADLMRDLVKLG